MSETMVSNGYRAWQQDCGREQQSVYTRFGDRKWDAIERRDKNMISSKIAQFMLNKQMENCSEGEQMLITKSMNKLLELSGGSPELDLGCTYVSYLTIAERKKGLMPILRTRNRYDDDKVFFFESESGRVYTGWSDYEMNNQLPKCYMGYPEDGFYTGINGRVVLKFSKSTACSSGIFKTMDVVSGCAGAISSVCLVGSLIFPPLALPPVAFTAGTTLTLSSVYGGSRAVGQMVDRSAHHQTINPLVDGDAFVHWINVVASCGTLAIGGVGMAANMSSFTSSNVKFFAHLMRYISFGVNSFGIVVSLVYVIVQWMKGELCSRDIDVFIALCVFVGNIVLTRDTAAKVIGMLADQPRRIRNFLMMVKNTTFENVKRIVAGASMCLESVLQCLTGNVGMQILRSVGLKKTIEVVKFIQRRWTLYRSGRLRVIQLLIDVHHQILPLMNEFLYEVKEAVFMLQKVFGQIIEYIMINGKRLFRRNSCMLALQIVDEVEGLIVDAQIRDPSEREQVITSVLQCAKEFADSNTIACQSDREFQKICEFLTDKINASYDPIYAVELSGRNLELLRDSKKTEIFKEIIRNLNMQELANEYRKKEQKCLPPTIFNKSLYETVGISMHYFVTGSDIRAFNQFLYDAACELLKTDLTLRECMFHFRNGLFVIEYKNKSVMFEYEKDSEDRMIGVAIINEERQSR